MKRWTIRVFSLWILCLGVLPALCRSEQPQCLPTWIAAGQRTITPSEVTGAPKERLELRSHHPEDSRKAEQSKADNGYLLTGDKVDSVTTCDGFTFVRFHGPKRVSTGWVEEARIRATGPALGTLPSNATSLCKAAEDTLSRDTQLASPPTTALDDGVLSVVHLERGWNGSPTRAAHVSVDGRPMVAIVVDSGGTSHDTSVYVLSSDLKHLLSPADRDDRDVENHGDDSWGFGVSEELVTVLGRPMVLSWDSGDGDAPAHLSLIDRDGDIVPTCEIKMEVRKEREIASSTEDGVCHAILAGRQVPVPMHSPLSGESLVLSNVPKKYRSEPDSVASMAAPDTTLHYHNNERASEVKFSLVSTGTVDLDNSGNSRRVGLVSFFDGDSTASDGTYRDIQALPVYLDKHGVADLSADANHKLADALPHGMRAGRLVTLDGATYLELSYEENRPSSEVWKINPGGALKVCEFNLMREVVRPIAE